MIEENTKKIEETKKELIKQIHTLNQAIKETKQDKEILRGVRDSLISSIDYISHLEYKELI